MASAVRMQAVSTHLNSSSKVEFQHTYQPTVTIPSTPVFQYALYPREIVFLLGAPGSGKGTHSKDVASLRRFNAPTIVMSDLLNSPTCKTSKDRGIMVDDKFVFNTLIAELQKSIYRHGVVVDGFPRTATQMKYLSNFYTGLNQHSSESPRILFVMLHCDEAASIARQHARGMSAQLMNHTLSAQGKPHVEVRLTDLSPTAAQTRYKLFESQCAAVWTEGARFEHVVVDASQAVDQVRDNIRSTLSSAFPSPF